jgi:hypothetical protein
VLEGEFKLLAANPELPDELHSASQECVDHHIVQDDAGIYHLWGCIRHTLVGRILYRWEGRSIVEVPWQDTGELIRAHSASGESLRDWRGQEWLQSPFFVRHDGVYFMFYGGHGTGVDEEGRQVDREDPRTACQMCMMHSQDGRQWQRHRNADGLSRLFTGPGETRDPCVVRVGDLWHMYYAGYDGGDQANPGFYLRTSRDLIDWSDWQLVHRDFNFGSGSWETECPCVVERAGYWYLFRTQDYKSAKTHVFRSEDPCDFGIGDASDRYVGPISVAAPEIVIDPNGVEYITSSHDPVAGTMITRLTWVED